MQVLETYWCEWPGWSDCVIDDLPNIAAVTALTKSLLDLPDDSGLITTDQRSRYEALAAILPPLPTVNSSSAGGLIFTPARVLSSGTHNSEVPEVFGSHPYRLVTVGRAMVSNFSGAAEELLQIGRRTWPVAPNAQANTGW